MSNIVAYIVLILAVILGTAANGFAKGANRRVSVGTHLERVRGRERNGTKSSSAASIAAPSSPSTAHNSRSVSASTAGACLPLAPETAS